MRRWYAVVVLTIFLAPMLMPNVVAEAEDFIDVEYNSDPLFSGVNVPINLLEPTTDDTVIGQWITDMGDLMPNGTFYGPLMATSKFGHAGRASWFPNNSREDEGQFTYLIFSAHFNLTPQQIMSGSSEFWLRTPFGPNAVDAGFGLVLGIFENENNPDDVTLPTTFTSPTSGRYEEIYAPRPTIDGAIPDMFLSYNWWDMDANNVLDPGTPITEGEPYYQSVMTQDRLYLKVNAIIEPATDYVVSLAFRWAKDQQLFTYWATAEEPTGNTSTLTTCEVDIDDEVFTLIGNESMNVGMDMDWSFIFTQGVGAGGMFGKKIRVDKGSTLYLFPYFNTSRDGTQYMSFVIPFISEDTVEIHPTIYNAHGITLASGGGWHTWEFNPSGGEGADLTTYFSPSTEFDEDLSSTSEKGIQLVELDATSGLYAGLRVWLDDDDSPSEAHILEGVETDGMTVYLEGVLDRAMETGENAHLWAYPDTYYEYRDFMAWSSNRTLDWGEFEDESMWNVMIGLTFNNSANLTLLCHADDRPTAQWSDLVEGHYNTSLYPAARPTLYATEGPGEKMAYDVWVSARGTDGVWAQMSTDSDGNAVYTHYFPQVIQLSRAQWRLADDGEAVQEMLDVAGEAIWDMLPFMKDSVDAWNSGDYFRGIYIALKGSIMAIWDGVGAAFGWIYDRLSDVWESLKKFGEWVYTRLAEAIGKILNFIGQALDTIASFWNAFKYIIAPAVMIFVIGIVSMALNQMNPRRSGA